ncbi:MAG: 3-hydroxyacyl-ACP dehydratase FabZ [Desulfobacteraceae bacterium]|jgi:3-hydroxymyristoyl/3-hydroxydecanoyl-(acyl carrier protein) dehydratase
MTAFDENRIFQILPHREPFLFVDRIVDFSGGDRIETEFKLSPDLVFFKGHFPGQPIMPGVLVTEALAQTCGLLIGLKYAHDKEKKDARYFLARSEMKFIQPACPGDQLSMDAALSKVFGALFRFDVAAAVGQRCIAVGTLSLAEQP